MIALMELGISLTIVVVMIAVGALLMLIGLAVGLITHPLRTLAFLVNKIAALGGGLGLIGTPFAWFVVEHDDKDWNRCSTDPYACWSEESWCMVSPNGS